MNSNNYWYLLCSAAGDSVEEDEVVGEIETDKVQKKNLCTQFNFMFKTEKHCTLYSSDCMQLQKCQLKVL